jgi:alcohol dehydrogenase class IV
MYDADLAFNFSSPTRIVFGAGSLEELPMELETLACDKALIVTDTNLRKHTEIIDKAEKILGRRWAGTYEGVRPDSDLNSIERGAQHARDIGADSVISIGGGSAMDTAKGVALLMAHGGKLLDHQGFQNIPSDIAPHIAVPTTAGTGSEVTYAFVAKDLEAKKKLLFCDFHLIPPVAILDPECTVDLPKTLTAATGVDALTHAIEAMHSMQREPVADALAMHAIRLIRTHLPRVLEAPSDLESRGQMLLASTMAGMAFGNAQVGLVHAMAHTIGARHGVHHGTANGICLAPVIRFNAEEVPEVYAEAGVCFGLPRTNSATDDAMRFADEMEKFVAGCGLPTRLGQAGIVEADLAACAEQTLEDGSIVYNPRFAMDPDMLLELYKTFL